MSLASKGNLLVGRYRVVGRLGAGGMAVVVLAEDERLGRRVAIKRLHSDPADEASQRFEREAKVGASLNHPNIVAVYDIVADEDGVLIVMEYVDGHTLRHEMDRGPMAPARVIEVLSGMAAGLDHAHAQGVVHRDVKPANVLIADRDDAVKLTDLGIATAAERTNITRSGVVLGTAAYLAPERLDGHAGDSAVDVYATAAVAFEALSGRKAVTGKTAMEVARRVVSQPPPDLAEVLSDAPRAAAEVLKRGLAKDPAARPASAGELVRSLSAAYADAAIGTPAARPAPPRRAPAAPPPKPRNEPTAGPAPPEPPAPRRRARPGWLVPAALLAAALAVVVVLLAAGSGGSPRTQAGPAAAPSQKSKTAPPATSATPNPSATPAPATPAPATPAPASTPTDAVAGFYTRAANHDFNGAWSLGTDRLHAQFGSLTTFAGTFGTLRSIAFPKLKTASAGPGSATVTFHSVATHTDHTDRCAGQASLVRRSGQWLVDHLDAVTCKQKPLKH